MALPSFMQHLKVLEASGLIKSRKRGRVRTVDIHQTHLKRAAGWLSEQRGVWEQRLDQLDAHLKTMEKSK